MFIRDFRVLNINRVNVIFVACERLSHMLSQIPNFESQIRVSNFSFDKKDNNKRTRFIQILGIFGIQNWKFRKLCVWFCFCNTFFCADICHNTTTIKYLGVAALFGVCRDTEVCCLCYS